MRAFYDGYLEVRFYLSDLPLLYMGDTVETVTCDPKKHIIRARLQDNAPRNLKLIQREVVQERFPFDEDGIPFLKGTDCSELIKIIGFDIIMDKARFRKYVEEITPRLDETIINPFWDRGIAHNCQIDRIHIEYIPFPQVV